MISEDAEFEYYLGYKVPKHYTVPPDSTFPTETAATTRTTSAQAKKDEWLDAKIAVGMIALFGGGVAIGRFSNKKGGEKSKNW